MDAILNDPIAIAGVILVIVTGLLWLANRD